MAELNAERARRMACRMMASVPRDLSALDRVLEKVRYKPGWRLRRHDEVLTITLPTIDSLTGNPATFTHGVPIPFAIESYDEAFIRRWVFDQVCYVETHEAAELFRYDGTLPYFPHRPDGSTRTFTEAERSEPVKAPEEPTGEDIEVYWERRMRARRAVGVGYV